MQRLRILVPRAARRHVPPVVRLRTLAAARRTLLAGRQRLGAKGAPAEAVASVLDPIGPVGAEGQRVAGLALDERGGDGRAIVAEQRALYRFRALVEHSADGIVVVDAAGKVRYASPATGPIVGSETAAAIGNDGFGRIHPDDLASAYGMFARVTARAGDSGSLICRVRHEDGSWRTLEMIATNHFDNPDVGGMVVNYRDVTEREAAATTLRASEARFHTLWDIGVDAMALSDAQGVVLQANAAYCELYRLPLDEVVGHHFSAIFPPEMRAMAADAYGDVFAGETIPPMFEAKVIRADGTERTVESRVSFLTEDGRRVAMLSVVRDITERVRARVAYEQLAAIVESSEDAIVGTRLDGTITSWNEGAERLYGYRAGEALGQHVTLVIPPEGVAESSDLLARVGRGERLARLETVRRLKDGRVVEVALTVSPIRGADGVIIGASAIARDISERRRVEGELTTINRRLRVALADLATSRSRLHELFMQAPAIVATVRGPTHVFDLVNPHYVQMVGRANATELVGRPIAEALPELVSQGYVEILDRVYASGKVFVGTEMSIRLRSEHQDALEDHFVNFVIQPSRDAAGAVDGLLMFAQEVTAQVRAQQQLIQQERLRALGEMASGIAHDFNNALAPVVGFSELLLMVPGTLEDHVKARQYLELIFTSAKDAAAVVSRLGEFSRARDEGDVLKPVDLGSLVEQVIRLTRPRWHDQALASGRTVQVKMNRGPAPPVAGRAPELREILTNLLFNADDAMPKGGTITISVQPAPFGRLTAAGTPAVTNGGTDASAATDTGTGTDAGAGTGTRSGSRGNGDGVLLSVHDTGIGMSEETRRRCLEPFYTTKGQHGTGLGLAMVYGIVHRAGGVLTIDSAPGGGTTVTICLPAYVASPPAESAPALATTAPLRVLVVDDEPGVQQVTVEYLLADGHRPIGASSGREALERLRIAGPGAFDLVITDRAMPGMNGDDLALAIKAGTPGLPVILLTGFGALIDRSGVPAVDAVLSKPINLAALRQVLAAILH